LPVPEAGARSTRRLLAELGVLTGWDAAGRPLFFEEVLCHAPEERLFYRGRWHGGLLPLDAIEPRERDEIERFRAIYTELSRARGRDGRPAFAVPAEQSSRDPRYLELDRISMAEWLARRDLSSDFLRWSVDYATRDDFGACLEETSAWAGLHYFASRKLETEQLAGSRYLVWPEGNGWLVRQMLARMHGTRRQRALVHRVAAADKDGVVVDYLELDTNQARRLHARAAILAVPAFVARRLLEDPEGLPSRPYSPWIVANLHVRGRAEPDRAWDSMIHDSLGLGYVDAGHQRMAPSDRTVLTYFRAYGDRDPAATRAALLQKSWAELAGEVFLDLASAHPELPDQTERLDVMVWGHAMPRPRPGFLGKRPFDMPVMLGERIAWAHVDQTGFALFEEANLHGVRAAERVAEAIGADGGESWI
jgi:hypothetical protein